MARSYKKAIYKIKTKNGKTSTLYWREVRGAWSNTIRKYRPLITEEGKEDYNDLLFENHRAIRIDDSWDSTFDFEYKGFNSLRIDTDKYLKKYRRK